MRDSYEILTVRGQFHDRLIFQIWLHSLEVPSRVQLRLCAARWRHHRMLNLDILSNLRFFALQTQHDELKLKFGMEQYTMDSFLHATFGLMDEGLVQEPLKF